MSEIIDNRAHRLRTLKALVLDLHRGARPADVKDRMKALVRECDAAEIAAMEQQLLDEEGIQVKEIMGMCDLHSEVVREILVERAHAPVAAGHPVDTFRRENAALEAAAGRMEAALGVLADGADAQAGADPAALLECRRCFNELMDVDKHYLRKEHLLFSCLERHGLSGPSKVMWGKDDEVRRLLKQLGEGLAREDLTVAAARALRSTVADAALGALREMISKEENILLPLALQTLTEAEWAEIWAQSPQFGWCLVDPGEDYRPADVKKPVVPEAVVAQAEREGAALNLAAAAAAPGPGGEALVFPTGALSLTQLSAIFSTLPVDLTFVDHEDRVRFFSEGPDRVFARPKAVIGRKVQHCHPPSSVDVVERILDDFRADRQNVAEFWIDFHGRFVHIRYFAVRSPAGEYLGTLEVTQDATQIRALEGERRLLQY
ncbi:MAG: DUF438 domain-containing protein [Planctomycetes bacterium]|nr:DUF438 domain-containing protein [Planctomycetota bacterium]